MVDPVLADEERELSEQVLRWKALALRDIISMRPDHRERTVYSLIERLCSKGVLIKRRVLRIQGREHNARYVVVSKTGLEMLLGHNVPAGALEPIRPETAERVLLSNRLVFDLMKAGLPSERIIFRRDILRILGLPSRMSAVDWGIRSSEGIYTVHFRDRYNSTLIWRMIREARWANGVQGHIIVCKDTAAAARCRRAYYRFPKKRPAARCLLIVPLDSRNDSLLLVERILQPDAWLRKIIDRLNEIDAVRNLGVRGGRAGDLDVVAGRVWIGTNTSWLAADLRLWEMTALMQVYYGWDPRPCSGDQRAEKLIILVRSYRDAKLCARLASWDPNIVWVAESAPPGKAVFCTRDGCFMPADTVSLGLDA